MNYFDILLAKKLEDDRDPKVEGLSVSENGRYHEDGVVYDPVIVNVPQTPLSKLTVTENGTYTAPTGTAYNEVEVDVPLPENAYLLKDIPNTPTAIATFSDGSNLPMPKLEVGIEPVQEGSGDPSPENVRPISGWDEANVSVVANNLFTGEYDVLYKLPQPIQPNTIVQASAKSSGSTQIKYYDADKNEINYWTLNQVDSNDNTRYYRNFKVSDTQGQPSACYIKFTTSSATEMQFAIIDDLSAQPLPYEQPHTYTIDLNGTRYGGKVDVVSGVMTVDRELVDMGDLTWLNRSDVGQGLFSATLSTHYKQDVNVKCMCSNYAYKGVSEYATYAYDKGDGSCSLYYGAGYTVYVVDASHASDTAAEFKNYIRGAKLVYELATPLTIQLTPTAVKSLLGSNNVFADTGDILDGQYFSKENSL